MTNAIVEALTRFILDPANHDILAILKGLRNGLVYGTKIRFPHALVMTFLFRSGTLQDKARMIYKATRAHALNLGVYVTIWKGLMLVMRMMSRAGKERNGDSLVAGLVGGWIVFGRNSSVNQQINLYCFSRVVLGFANLAVKKGYIRLPSSTPSNSHAPPSTVDITSASGLTSPASLKRPRENYYWPVFASVTWGTVMWLYQNHPDCLQPSLRKSMEYLYSQSDRWEGWRNFVWHNV
ncbi:peroxisomal membrane protein 4 [Saitoella complicata NRRL Y-17804]|uniref:peroxisomal membrane protein 4 n=1 Tax=Saitoella complicata (strain BCRC 22490 / CBS 7301 / JCM 7358 / NBRC 10748 / NRRL Y-17804) TaxID=698492 RepID=UPI0008674A7D|nr:peroxisomal membrane protein 4 [Saitoella complicata NRRL Y-17804]ODQ52286.1 peroxisomal membrane protein 4 [Saitoella complicata NRRL Y-17804]